MLIPIMNGCVLLMNVVGLISDTERTDDQCNACGLCNALHDLCSVWHDWHDVGGRCAMTSLCSTSGLCSAWHDLCNAWHSWHGTANRQNECTTQNDGSVYNHSQYITSFCNMVHHTVTLNRTYMNVYVTGCSKLCKTVNDWSLPDNGTDRTYTNAYVMNSKLCKTANDWSLPDNGMDRTYTNAYVMNSKLCKTVNDWSLPDNGTDRTYTNAYVMNSKLCKTANDWSLPDDGMDRPVDGSLAIINELWLQCMSCELSMLAEDVCSRMDDVCRQMTAICDRLCRNDAYAAAVLPRCARLYAQKYIPHLQARIRKTMQETGRALQGMGSALSRHAVSCGKADSCQVEEQLTECVEDVIAVCQEWLSSLADSVDCQ